MEETKDQTPSMSPVEEEVELSHTDKLVGIFTEPAKTYSKMSEFPPKTSDWIIPLIVAIVFAILSNIIMMSNPVIKSAILEKQMAQVEKQFDEMVKNGQMTEQQKEERLESIREGQGGAIALIGTIIGIPFAFFIMFFIVSGVFYLLIKFALKGEGTYKSAMSAYGLAYYIIVVQIIVMVILAFTMNRFFQSVSIADILNIDKSNFGGFLLGKADIFSIWFYAVIGIGFAKMFKSPSVTKYVVMVFAVWLGFSIVFFFIGKSIPFLRAFAGA
ncbi:YIP1 family protein [Melioribacteraceae bacterium 4301-Me]|uniref:YIP1 family protein n=1 Tax=Pyranulibacter aquaticus TaxID=3163344 RepID=UPI003596A52D